MALAIGGLALVTAAASWRAATASLSMPQDLQGQLAASEMVLEGYVERVFTCPDAASGLPRTCAAIRGATFFKGYAQSGQVILLLPGGALPDGRFVRMIGAPHLRGGETVIASAIVKPGSDAMLVLANFDTALLRHEVDGAGRDVAANAVGRRLGSLPVTGRALYLPGPESPVDGVDFQMGSAPVSRPALPRALAWADARRAVGDGLRALADSRLPALAARTIAGATGNEGGQP
jgi:hypothetical protein